MELSHLQRVIVEVLAVYMEEESPAQDVKTPFNSSGVGISLQTYLASNPFLTQESPTSWTAPPVVTSWPSSCSTGCGSSTLTTPSPLAMCTSCFLPRSSWPSNPTTTSTTAKSTTPRCQAWRRPSSAACNSNSWGWSIMTPWWTLALTRTTPKSWRSSSRATDVGRLRTWAPSNPTHAKIRSKSMRVRSSAAVFDDRKSAWNWWFLSNSYNINPLWDDLFFSLLADFFSTISLKIFNNHRIKRKV